MRVSLFFLFELYISQMFAISFIENVYWYNNNSLDVNRIANVKGVSIPLKTYVEFVCNENFEKESFVFEAYEKGCMVEKREVLDLNKDSEIQTKHIDRPFLTSYYIGLEVSAYPEKILIKKKDGELLNEFKCRYADFSGGIQCNLPHMNYYVMIAPNNMNDPNILFFIGDVSEYSIKIPLRDYYCFAFFCDTYGEKTLENWVYNFSVKKKKYFYNITIGNVELYGLLSEYSRDNGLKISFRPMSLNETEEKDVVIGGEKYTEIDFKIPLTEKDVELYSKGRRLVFDSLMSSYEINGDIVVKSYVLNKRSGVSKGELYTIKVRYEGAEGNSSIFLK